MEAATPRFLITTALLTLMLSGCGCDRSPSGDLEKAVTLAEAELTRMGKPLDEYRLTGAQEFVVDGRYVWRVTWKPTHLLPEDPATGLIGLGGELFVNVVLETGEATVRYGE